MRDERIIFVNRVYWPSTAATAQLLTDLAEALAARGWPVHVIAAGTGAGPRNGVEIHRTGPGEKHGGLISRAGNFRRFMRAARRELEACTRTGDVVVLMTDPPLLSTLGTGLARRRRVRVVQWIQDIYPEIVTQHAGAWLGPFLRPLKFRRNRAWRAADRCLPVSGDMRPTVLAQGVPVGAVTVMPNWAPPELDVPPAAADVDAIRASWGAGAKFVVAYSGNLGRVHEFDALLDAADLLRGETDVAFLFIGDGARFAEVRSAAASRGLSQVRFLPPQPRNLLAASLAAADAHFVTVRPGFERLVSPSKLAGILAAGRPALFVGPPDSELAALLAREGAGFSFAPTGNRELADKIVALRNDRELREKTGRAARHCYERHFAFATAVTRWDELLRGVVAGRT